MLPISAAFDYLTVVLWDTNLPSFISSVTTTTFLVDVVDDDPPDEDPPDEDPPAPKLWK